ncbi:MAG: alcohol dehydrogenase family protein [Actinomycetota bacterium]|nr:alcohol dehydrogenase family protein [Actinomycetota bacterium]
MGHGGPEQLEYREDVPDPEPAEGEVVIRVGAAALNNTDIWTREGAYGAERDRGEPRGWQGEPLRFPRIQGADIAGRIETVGARVSGDRIGERVLVDNALYGGDGEGLFDAGIIGSERDGGFAELVAVPAENAHRIESELTDAELASFPTAYVTAERMLNRARLAAGETVLVTGASGGVGTGLVQLAKARGATVIALVGRGKEDLVSEIGADAVVTRREDVAQSLREAVARAPLDVVADVVGGEHVRTLLELLRPGGRYVVAGAIAGPLVTVDLRTVYLKQLDVLGSTMGNRDEFAALVRHIESGRLRPLVSATYPLAALGRAQADFVSKSFVGKLVVIP